MPAVDSRDEASSHGPAVFVTTHWSLVVRAKEQGSAEAAAALAELCAIYWRPLYVFARRFGRSPADAEDLTQSFFARLLEKRYLAAVDQDRGRFRSFLLTAFKRFMANEWDREHRQKRGGFATVVPMDRDAAEAGLGGALADRWTPDHCFERQWALTLLERVRQRLEDEYAATGRAELWEQAQGCVVRDRSAPAYAEIAGRLGLTEAAVKMTIQRLRARYRILLREEIGKTVANPAEVEDEIRYLLGIFNH